MPIKGLFNRDENNDDELEKLIKKVKMLELKTNTLDVHMRRFVKLENRWQAEAFSSKYKETKKEKHKESLDRAANEKKFKQDAVNHVQKHVDLHLPEQISEKLNPIHEEVDSLADRLTRMEKKFEKLHTLVEENLQQTLAFNEEIKQMKMESTNQRKEKSIVIQELRVDKVMLDKYEQNNNFGCLGIKEISGQLNIGATYGKSAIPAEIAEELTDDLLDLQEESAKVDKEDGEASSEASDEVSGNESSDESSDNRHGGGHSAYFTGEQQIKDDNDGFTDVPIE